MKKWVIRFVVIILVAGMSFFGVKEYKALTTPQKTHYHAGFVVFANNKKVDFSPWKLKIEMKPLLDIWRKKHCQKNKRQCEKKTFSEIKFHRCMTLVIFMFIRR